MTSYCRGVFELSAHKRPIVGDTKMSVIQYDHLGWIRCDGRQLTVADYRFLFEVLGYSFGGSGAYFNLPDPAGRVPGVTGSGTGLTSRVLGDTVGEEQHTLTIAEMPSHNHGVASGGQVPTNNLTSENTHNHSGNTGFEATSITINNNATGITGTNPGGVHTHSTNATAGAPGQGLAYRDGNSTRVNADSGQVNELNLDTMVALQVYDSASHVHGITDPQHNHAITDPTHRHTIENYTHSHTMNPAGGSNAHNNMQPTLFMGNIFIYSGKGTLVFQNVPFTTGTNIY